MRALMVGIATVASLAAGLAPAWSAAPVVGPVCRAVPADVPVRLTFHEARLVDVLSFFSCVTGRPIITELDIAAPRVDLHHDRPVPLRDAVEALRRVLLARGLALSERDGAWLLERILV